MARVSQPELKKYLNKRIMVNIQGERKIRGILRGYDIFLNLVIDESTELVKPPGSSANAWRDAAHCGTVVVRGNSVTSLEGLETIDAKITSA